MLLKNILPSNKIRRIIAILIIINMFIYIMLSCATASVNAAQTKESYSDKISNYSGYKELIDALKQAHPNWNFTVLYTGLDWNEVIKNETVAYHGRSLVSAAKSGYWFCSTCGNKAYDNGSWKCASETAVAYYLDPRNWINEDYIFQFEDLSYNKDVQTVEGVNQILLGTWMDVEKISYIDTEGATQTLDKSYAQVIMEAASQVGISPYHLAARIRQEQGVKAASSTGSGNYEGYVGYYNLLNINASGNGSGTIITRALTHAKTAGWTDPEKSILGGAEFLASEYIGVGQSTVYLQKFDVDSSDGGLYYHQYMQNIEAAMAESIKVKSSYETMGFLDNKINFVIPVFENMPAQKSVIPGTNSIVTQNVEVKGTDVIVRAGQGAEFAEIARVNAGDKLLRIEIANEAKEGHFWDKIVLADGTKGYISRLYINQIEDITNTNQTAITNTGVNLRNGPGTQDTAVIITLSRGQAVTVLETGQYNGLDGYNWSKVKLQSGVQGYLVSSYVNITVNGEDSSGNTIAKIKGTGVRLRKGLGTDTDIVTTLTQGETVTITKKSAGTANGYTWDKIVTGAGLEGYVANQYLEIVQNTTNQDYKYDENDNLIIMTLGITIEKIENGIAVGEIKTGAKITINGVEYKAVVLGDTNGDGNIDSADLLSIRKHLLSKEILTEEYKKSADVNNDEKVDSADLLAVRKQLLGKENISL